MKFSKANQVLKQSYAYGYTDLPRKWTPLASVQLVFFKCYEQQNVVWWKWWWFLYLLAVIASL